MNTIVVDVDNFAGAVVELVQKNIDDNELLMKQDVHKAGEVAAEWLRKHAPYDSWGRVKNKKSSDFGALKLAHYRDGWTSYFSDRLAFSHMVTATVATKTEPSLTHLLEFGHEMFVHGHDTGKRVPAYPHISTAFGVGKKVLESAKVDN